MPNPFAGSRGYARLSMIIMVPLFTLFPVPRGFALLTVTGRRSGRRRRRPVRAVRRDDTVYTVAMMGERAEWLRNVRANPHVSIKLGLREHEGTARQLEDPSEWEEGFAAFTGVVNAQDYVDYVSFFWGFPTRRKIQRALETWAREGILVAIDLEPADTP
jgi:deazaflavin-dependent oxidoreductase (nitroreductase family)